MQHTLKPIEAPFPQEVADILGRYPQGPDGSILKLFRVFANSMRFLKNAPRQAGVWNLLGKDSPISLRERELVILRVTANTDCEYEWGVHVSVFAEAAGLSDAQVAATRSTEIVADIWPAEDMLLLRCVDDLCKRAKISDAHYDEFCSRWDQAQQLEILALCGNYHTISYVANTARLTGEAQMATFPGSTTYVSTQRRPST